MSYAVWLSAALLGHGALWVEVVNRLHGYGLPRKLVDALTAACGLAVVGVPCFAAWRLATEGALGGIMAAYASASIACLVVVAVSRALLRWDPQRLSASETALTTETLDLAESLGEAAATGPALIRRAARLPGNQLLRVAVEHREIPLERLPHEFDGLKVAHLTDLHMSGRLSIDYYRALVEQVNAWSPDFVFITGDIVEHPPQLEWVEPVLGRLQPGVASHFILGNHDEKVNCAELRRRLESVGVADVGGGTCVYGDPFPGLKVCGDERPWFGRGPRLAGDESLVLCLAHTPDRFASAADAGIDLVLAGHCHGGQVCFPLIGPLLCPSRHGVRYAEGTFRRGRTVMHASRGSGSLFPLRYRCPPELGLFTLRPKGPANQAKKR